MSDIYAQHRKAFDQVAAYVIMKDGARVATVAFRYPHDGAGRLWAYVHWLGTEMVRGYASGGGYDKHSAAVASAIHGAMTRKHALMFAEPDSSQDAFRAAMGLDDGEYWYDRLRKAGFEVLQAV